MAKNKEIKAKEFTQTKIRLCDEEHYFKRCSNKTLREFDERIEQKFKEAEPITKESTALNDKKDRLDSKIDSMKRRIDLMERKEDLSDEEIDKVMEYHDKLDEYYEELEEHLEKIRLFNEEHEGFGNEITDDINRIMAEKVEAVVDGITADEFLEKADAIDIHIADNISKYYEMCMIGERASKIQQEIRDDCEEFRKRQKEARA